MTQLETLKNDLLKEHEALETYLDVKRKSKDWHGVQDAASDLRDIESELRILDLVEAHKDWQ